MKWTWTRRSQVAPCQGHPGGWLELGWAWTRVFWTGDTLAGCQTYPGGMAGAEADVGHRFPSVCHSGAALMEWLELVWARGSGLDEAAGWLEHLLPVPSCAVRWRGSCQHH